MRDEERRWKRLQEVLAAEASGKSVRPAVSQRTLFGIPSTVEETIERIVAEDESARLAKRAGEGRAGEGRAGGVQHVEHPLEPIFDGRSRVLVLGTMPSPKSRAVGFYYGHPQNRFWRVLAALFDEPVATTNERRRDQLLRHGIALWDVLASCDISGASDASIVNAVPNDLSRVFDAAPIRAVFCTGAKAAELYARHCQQACGIPATKLPSTSAANAAMRLDDLVEAYRVIVGHLDEPAPRTLDVPDVVALEQAIDAAGTPLAELMDRAGLAIAHRVHALSPGSRAAVLCGNGNNGGDGWVAARYLLRLGHAVTLICARMPEALTAQPARQAAEAALRELRADGGKVLCDPGEDELARAIASADVVIDCILGTGFSGTEVRDPFNRWIDLVNDRRGCRRGRGLLVVAADVPSGLNAQTGEAATPCIRADATITMMTSKPGLHAGAAWCGNVYVAPLAYLEPFLGAPMRGDA